MSEPEANSPRRGSIAIIVRDSRLLVIRRSRFVIAPGTLCFPGGGIEADESEQEALIRELREELGVAVRPLRRIWQSVTPWQVHLSWWLSQIERQAEPVPNPAEVESVHWYTAKEMLEHPDLLESNREFLQGVISGEIGPLT